MTKATRSSASSPWSTASTATATNTATAATAATPIRAGAGDKVPLDFAEIAARLKSVDLPQADVVYAIATGGIVPGALVAYQLGVGLKRLDINFRAVDNSPQRAAPELLVPADVPPPGTAVMLVDDVSVTGKTLELARSLLAGCKVTTLVLKGKGADFVLFPEVASCVIWPWNG